MKPIVIRCDFCQVDICDEKGRCAFAVSKRVIDGQEYQFCCEAHADRFEKERKKKRK